MSNKIHYDFRKRLDDWYENFSLSGINSEIYFYKSLAEEHNISYSDALQTRKMMEDDHRNELVYLFLWYIRENMEEYQDKMDLLLKFIGDNTDAILDIVVQAGHILNTVVEIKENEYINMESKENGTLKLTKYEIRLLESALIVHESKIAQETFPPFALITKEFLLTSIQNLQKKISKELEK